MNAIVKPRYVTLPIIRLDESTGSDSRGCHTWRDFRDDGEQKVNISLLLAYYTKLEKEGHWIGFPANGQNAGYYTEREILHLKFNDDIILYSSLPEVEFEKLLE